MKPTILIDMDIFDVLLNIADEIHLDEQLKAVAITALKEKPDLFNYCDDARKLKRSCLNALNPIERLAIVLATLPDVKAEYERRGIPDDIFVDTMRDISIWCNDYNRKTGKIGLKNSNWIINHLSLDLFRIGRLQFQFSKMHLPPYASPAERKNCPLPIGTPCLYVHIAEGSPLDFDACTQSFIQAESFFAKFYPEYHYKAYISESWLYHESLESMLPADSNILRFSARFKRIASSNNPHSAIERIFGKRYLTAYPKNTGLQRAALERMKKHPLSALGSAMAIIILE